MKAVAILAALASLTAALPQANNPCANLIPAGAEGATSPDNVALAQACTQGASGKKRQSLIEQLQETFDRDNPNGTPAAEGDPDDLNGDGVINVFEAGAATG